MFGLMLEDMFGFRLDEMNGFLLDDILGFKLLEIVGFKLLLMKGFFEDDTAGFRLDGIFIISPLSNGFAAEPRALANRL